MLQDRNPDLLLLYYLRGVELTRLIRSYTTSGIIMRLAHSLDIPISPLPVSLSSMELPQSNISPAQRIGWGLSTGHLFPVATAEGGRGHLSLSAARMTANLQSYLRMADLPNHFTMHSFRVGGSLSKSLAGTAVDEIMKIGGWKTESVAKYYIGATSSGQVRGSKETWPELRGR